VVNAASSAVAAETRVEQAWRLLDTVLDPEVPVVSVRDLGIVRDVVDEGDALSVVLTPTYSGCPATEMIEASVREALVDAGLGPVKLRLQRAPAWTTDWISADGRRKLREYGIVPPGTIRGPLPPGTAQGPLPPSRLGTPGCVVSAGASAPLHFVARARAAALPCPRCESANTERLSAFGSTACKALYRCRACGEPFEYFKPI
jgi:ring-1,2-phenylacetyl-CoA epoxidase subunit PaaD